MWFRAQNDSRKARGIATVAEGIHVAPVLSIAPGLRCADSHTGISAARVYAPRRGDASPRRNAAPPGEQNQPNPLRRVQRAAEQISLLVGNGKKPLRNAPPVIASGTGWCRRRSHAACPPASAGLRKSRTRRTPRKVAWDAAASRAAPTRSFATGFSSASSSDRTASPRNRATIWSSPSATDQRNRLRFCSFAWRTGRLPARHPPTPQDDHPESGTDQKDHCRLRNRIEVPC